MNVNTEIQLRHVFQITSGATPSSTNGDYWDGDLLWITPQDLSGMKNYWLEDTQRKISESGHHASGTVMAPIHSIALSKRAPIGQLAILKKPACSNQGCFLLIPRMESDSRFFLYWLSYQKKYLQALGRGSTFMELSTDDLKAIRVPSFTPSRQRSIADYLDRETARLDALAAAKERMLELLAERRHALIVAAVTGDEESIARKETPPDAILEDRNRNDAGTNRGGVRTSAAGGDGMSPNTDMQLRHVFQVTSGATPASRNGDYWDGDLLWVTPQDLSNMKNYCLEDTQRKISESGYRASGTVMAPIHSIVLSKRAPIGLLAILKKPSCSNQGCFLLIPRIDSDSRFFLYWLSCQTKYLQALGQGSTFMELSTDDLKATRVPSIAPSRQRAIADYLDRETIRLDTLEAKVNSTIALLKERRASLIAAAVTGQIDVERAA